MWDHQLRVVKPGKIHDPYAPKKASRTTLDPTLGATVETTRYPVEFQPISLVEDTEQGVRQSVESAWAVITQRGVVIPGIQPEDGVLIELLNPDGSLTPAIDGVLQVVGEVGQWPTPARLAHTEFTVKRWLG